MRAKKNYSRSLPDTGKVAKCEIKISQIALRKKYSRRARVSECEKKIIPRSLCWAPAKKKLFLGGPSTVQNAKLKFRIHLGSLV